MSASKTFKTLRQSLLIAVTSATFLVGCGQPDSKSTSDIVSETSSTLDLNDAQAREMARLLIPLVLNWRYSRKFGSTARRDACSDAARLSECGGDKCSA